MENNSSISNFKQFSIRFVLPVMVAIIMLFSLLSWLVESLIIFNCDSSGGYKVHRMLFENDLNEIPIFGSSRANGSYIPSLIDSNCFNYGLEKTEIDYLLLCLETELEKTRCTPIIINFDYGLFARKVGNIAHFVPSASHPKVQSYLGDLYSLRMRVPLMKYFGHFDTYSKTLKAEFDAFHCLDRGCFILKDPTLASFKTSLKLRAQSNYFFEIDSCKNQKLINLLNKTERKIYFVIAPYHRVFFESCINMPDAVQYLKTLNDISSVAVIDLGAMNLNDDEFLNTGHVNFWGAEKFSIKLKSIIFQSKTSF
jgi:hypothetical protein